MDAIEKPRKAKAEKPPKGIRKIQPSGRYQVRYTGPDGKRYTGGTFRRQTDAVRELGTILDEIEAATRLKIPWIPPRKKSEPGAKPGGLTVRDLSEEWIQSRVNDAGRELAPKTVELYRRLVDHPLAEFADKPIRQIHPEKVLEWWNRAEFGKARTRNAAYKYLKSLLDWAQARRLIPESPCKIANGVKYKPKPQTVPTDTELAIILETAEGDDLRAVLALTAYCGLRPQEVLALRRRDISSVEYGDKTRWLVTISEVLSWLKGGNIVRKEPKSSAGKRELSVPAPAVPYLLKHLESVPSSADALLFSRDTLGLVPWAQTRLNQRFEKPKTIAGYEGSPYAFRHYHLTEFAKTGATTREIMKRGGHSSITAAMRYQVDTGRDLELTDRFEKSELSPASGN
ncbi:MAG: tyrosine-type recombinase/integrase [Pontimonas sp.]|nr:tyrosine-type recombinase/integrase [Pontimonas sp.]